MLRSRTVVVVLGLGVSAGCAAPRTPPPSLGGLTAGEPSSGPPESVWGDAPAPELVTPAPQLEQNVPPPEADTSARFFNSPSEQRDELAVHPIGPHLYAGLEGEAQADHETQGTETSQHVFLDSVTTGLRWVPLYGLDFSFEGSYDLQPGGDGYSTDEAIVTLGAIPAEPWYVTAGYTDLPFGEFNSHFRDDPLTQVLGEMQSEEVAGGYESDFFEATLAVGDNDSGNNGYVWIANVTGSPAPNLDIGAYWTSDISASTEIQQFIKDARADDPSIPAHDGAVQGAGAFLALGTNRYTFDLEYIEALQSFSPGMLGPGRETPWAWNCEVSVRPTNPWEVGLRYAKSGGLGDSPTTQYGVETQYSIGEHLALSLEYLRGIQSNGDANTDTVTAGLLVRW